MSARHLDMHVLQTVPYANLNRDDLGSPKTVQYGGIIRTRVSSQCWKRAVRLDIEQRIGDPAVRTRRIALELARDLTDHGWEPQLATVAGQQVVGAAKAASGKSEEGGLKTEPGGETSVLLYLPQRALGQLRDLCDEHRSAIEAAAAARSGKKTTAAVLPTDRVVEIITGRNDIINLFGRMLAELPGGGVDGAVQVAHAFTTHIAEPEVDFFTAMDDWLPADAQGSGHMNSAEFSTGVFYRYASVNLADLTKNLGGDADGARQLAGAFLDAFITALPHAKKNSTAPFTVPDLAYLTVRDDRPLSLAAAFEAAVRAGAEGGGYARPSQSRLDEYAGKIYTLLGPDGLRHHAHASIEEKHQHLGERAASFRQLVDSALAAAGRQP